MMPGPRAIAVEAARSMLDISFDQLWVDYLALGGSLAPDKIQTFLTGERLLGDHDHDILVQALNERFTDHNEDHPLGYADELDDESNLR